jgi:transcriptional regulator of acetoin/glycerol metabolism
MRQLLLHLLGEEARGQILRLEARARQALLGRRGPGNVRRTLADARENVPPTPLDDAERSALLAVLETQRWHMTRSAEQLGISRNTLYRKLRKHAIRPSG